MRGRYAPFMTSTKTIVILLLLLRSSSCLSQGHIDHIKNQEYLKLKDRVDCTHSEGDNLSERICANLAFQKSDSLLTVVYDSLIIAVRKIDIDSAETKIIRLQAI